MQNINPLFLLVGLVPLVFSISLVLYWRRRGKLKWIVLPYSLVAYAGAIALKYAVQIPTYSTVISRFGYPSVGVALYLGLQTVFFEVGGAFLVAKYAVGKGHLGKRDAESYGISLSFWENGVLLGLFTSVNLITYYLILGYGPTSLANSFYNLLMQSQPGLFNTGNEVFVNVFLSNLERVSSAMAHISWGILTLLAAVLKKRKYFLMALPMGLIDALVPYASSIGIILFEGILFVVTLFFLFLAVRIERSWRNREPA